VTGKAVVTGSKVTGDKIHVDNTKNIVIPDPDDIRGLLGVIK
jgi:hypothetical protein